MHFSSDYVFDGFRSIPYSEEDMPRPLSVYGVSKLAGEFFVRSILSQYFLIRTCGLFGTAGCWGKGYNFVDTMVRLAREKQPIRVVNDQYVTPTSTLELAMRLADLIESGEHGLYHMTNTGECSWYEFAAEIFNLMGVETDLEGVDSETFGARAQRPAFSVLDNRHAEELGLPGFSPWTAALKDYLQRKGHLKL
jgi:dTDP-4-dehydrorhamnose reductase